MKPLFALVFIALLPGIAIAQQTTEPQEGLRVQPVGTNELNQFLWTNRVVVVFADTEADPRFAEQIALLQAGEAEMLDRDVVVLTDTDPAAKSAVRLQLRPRGFQMVLVGKDGGVKLRKPFPWNARELSRSIDKTPLREREVRERRDGS